MCGKTINEMIQMLELFDRDLKQLIKYGNKQLQTPELGRSIRKEIKIKQNNQTVILQLKNTITRIELTQRAP